MFLQKCGASLILQQGRLRFMPDSNVKQKTSCALIIPVFNEQDAIPVFMSRINEVFAGLPDIALLLVFVDDGSTDETLSLLQRLQEKDPRIIAVALSRNFGKEAALTAGLAVCGGKTDIVVPIDADLQDPPELIPEMICKWREGFDVVLARRASRRSDSFFKRASAKYFYNVINHISSVKIPSNVGDFRLLDRSAVKAINSLPESCRFMKGLFSYIGFKTVSIEYTRPVRCAGESKFRFWKLWNFALDGITSFSTVPLRVWSYVGLFISVFSLLVSLFFLLRTVLFGVDVPGYASLIVAVTFLGGMQLLGVGILGEYLGRIFLESKRRPIYFIRKIYGNCQTWKE